MPFRAGVARASLGCSGRYRGFFFGVPLLPRGHRFRPRGQIDLTRSRSGLDAAYAELIAPEAANVGLIPVINFKTIPTTRNGGSKGRSTA